MNDVVVVWEFGEKNKRNTSPHFLLPLTILYPYFNKLIIIRIYLLLTNVNNLKITFIFITAILTT